MDSCQGFQGSAIQTKVGMLCTCCQIFVVVAVAVPRRDYCLLFDLRSKEGVGLIFARSFSRSSCLSYDFLNLLFFWFGISLYDALLTD